MITRTRVTSGKRKAAELCCSCGLELAKLVIEMKQNASFSVKVGVDFMFTFNNEDRKDSYNRKKSLSKMKRDEFMSTI